MSVWICCSKRIYLLKLHIIYMYIYICTCKCRCTWKCMYTCICACTCILYIFFMFFGWKFLLEVIPCLQALPLQLCLNQRHRGILNLDGPIDTTHEGEGAAKTYRSVDQPKDARHNEHVPKVHQHGHPVSNLESGIKVHDGIREDIESWTTTGREGGPPPSVVLRG